MDERYINCSNVFLYYIVSPCLLLYFTLIDFGIVRCSFEILALFIVPIVVGISLTVFYKKKNANYSFDINKSYANIMSVLVLLELAYSFTK